MNDYYPPETDLIIANHIQDVVEDFLNGMVDGIALVAMRSNGAPCTLYMNKTSEPVLRNLLQGLITDYEAGSQCRKLVNAPETNRSYRTH